MPVLTHRFKLEAQIGKGGFGEVWRAQDLELRRTVAIKLMEPGGSGGSPISGALEHAQALARVNHPNVVRIYDIGTLVHPSTGDPWNAIVMELLDGPSLAQRLTRELSSEQADGLCRGLLDGLEALHEAGIAHSDLHDENVMLHDDVPKILDVLYRGTLDGAPQAQRNILLGADIKMLRSQISNILAHSFRQDGATLFRRLSHEAEDVASVRIAFERAAQAPSPAIVDVGAAELTALVRTITRRNIQAMPTLPALRALTGGERVTVKRAVIPIPDNQGHGGHSPPASEAPIEETGILSGHQALDRCVVFADGGGGKSTLLASLAQRSMNDPTLAPLLLNVAEAVEGHVVPRSLVEVLARYLEVRTQLEVPRAELDRALRSNMFLLLIDGLDEIHDRRRLKAVVTLINDFATTYKKCRLAVTARPWVESEAPLEGHAFTKVRLAPLSGEAIRELVRDLAAHAETRGSVVRAPDEITDFILENSDLQDLAGNPLLCTLMALISLHSQEQNYSNRMRIYGRSLDLLLLEWPQNSARQPGVNDAGVSFQVLQHIAIRMHESGQDWLTREAVIDECIAFFGARGGAARVEGVKWWLWQREEIALLQEDEQGRVRFFHRSFQDCLAANAILSRFGRDTEGLLRTIHNEYGHRRHDTLCFLLTAPQLPGDVVERTIASFLDLRQSCANPEGKDRWWGVLAFLLQLVQVGAELSDAMFDRVMDEAARASLDHCNKFFHGDGNIMRWRQMLASVSRRGHRHQARMSRWFDARLFGEDLELRHGALWIRPPEMCLPASSLERPGAARALAAACDLGILHPFGRWAHEKMTWEGLALWARSCPLELALGRCLEACMQRWDLWLRDLCLALFRRMQWYGQTTLAALSSAAKTPSIPDVLVWRNGRHVFTNRLLPALIPFRVQDGLDIRPRRHFELESNSELDHRLTHYYVNMVIQTFREVEPTPNRHYLKEYFMHDYGLVFGPSSSGWSLPRLPAPDELLNPGRELSQRLAAPIWARLWNQQRVSYSLLCGAEIFSGDSLWLERGASSDLQESASLPGWRGILAAGTKSELASESHRMLLEQLAEVHTGVLTAASLERDGAPDRRARDLCLDVRVQNRWLLHHLDGIAAGLAAVRETPAVQSTLLALTLSQYQTTWSFPEAAWWSDLMAEEPQDDLAKALWHLVHAACGGPYQEHLELAATCLVRGYAPAVEFLCFPIPPIPPESHRMTVDEPV